MANNNWGQGSWGINNWGDQADTVFTVTGLSATTSQGTVTTDQEINEGWGRLTWGENAWGIAGDIFADGQSMTVSIGSVTANFGSSVIPTGQSLSAVQGTDTTIEIATEFELTGVAGTLSIGSTTEIVGDANVSVTGISTNTNVGSTTIDPDFLIGEGWGRGTWGNRVWGGAYTVIAQGQSLTTSQGTAIGKTDVDVSVTGLDLLTITQGLSSIQIDQDIFVFASEDQLDTSVGSTSQTGLANVVVTGNSASTSIGQVIPEPKIPVDVTGVSLTTSIGTISLEQSTNETATGQSATISLGTVDPVAVYPVTTAGLLTSSVGSVTATGTAVFPVTGIGLTANVGSVNVTAWNEINLGVNNVWTTVDKAA